MTTLRHPPKPLPTLRWCAVCADVPYSPEELKQHNLDSASHGERSYLVSRRYA